MHEFNRPDAWDYLDFDCEVIKGFLELQNYLDDHTIRNPFKDGNQPITIQDVCTSTVVAELFAPNSQGNALAQVVPADCPKYIGYELMPNPNSQSVKSVMLGPFNYDSVMMYPSNLGAANLANNVLVRKDKPEGQNVITPSSSPNAGDIAAVKMLYPDTLDGFVFDDI